MGFIRLKTNQPRLISNLKYAFTPHSMLGELLQNARRAGARSIQIDAYHDSIIVTDDGSGIADLQSLIHIAESSWDEELQRRENAFGMGILSTLYFSDHLFVHSGEHAFDARTVDIIAGKAIEVLAERPRIGTQIRLYGVKTNQTAFDLPEWVRRQLVSLCEAFPVPVSFNGIEMGRPWADPSLAWRDTAVGRVLLDLEASHLNWRCFLQGLPIGSLPNSTRKHIVLLRDDMIARLPDRQYLLDEAAENRRIQEAVSLAYRQALIEAKATMDAGLFLKAYGDRCLDSRNADLLNDVPFAKLSWFRDWEREPPGFRPYWNRSQREGVIGADALSTDSVWRIEAEDDDEPTTQCYVFARDGLLLEEHGLDVNHWLHDKVNLITPDDVIVLQSRVLHESRHLPLAGGVQLALVDSLKMSHADDRREFPVSAVRLDDTIFLTADAHDVIWLISDYVFDDRYDETARYDDEETIRKFIRVGRSSTPAGVIEALLPDELRHAPQPKLANARVHLAFDSDGKLLSVTS